MKSVIKIFNELASTNSPNEKEEIIRRNLDNELFDYCIKFYLDDTIITGIARAKLSKILELKNPIHGSFHTNLDSTLDYVKYFNTGRDYDIQHVINSARLHNDSEIEDLYYSLVCKDVKIGTGIAIYNKANPTNPIYKHEVMAGKAYIHEKALKIIKSGDVLYFTDKKDGLRGTRYTLISRNGKQYKGVEKIAEELKQIFPELKRIPDGELQYFDESGTMTSQQVRSMTNSIMSNQSIEDKTAHGIVYHIFDIPKECDYNSTNNGETYSERREIMDTIIQDKINELGLKYVKVVPVEFTVSTEDELDKVLSRTKEHINKGNEGYMMIAGKQAYKTSKGYQMMKLKNVISADLRIISWNYGTPKTRLDGKFASFTVEMPYVDKECVCGKYPVTVGMGYSHEILAEINKDPNSYIGKLIEILATEVSTNKEGEHSLSYARFVGFRDDKDTIDLEEHTLVEIDGEMYFKADKEIVDNEE
jgi:hypothetical protein